MSDIADVLNRLNELGRDDLAEVVTCLMGERDNLAVRLSESETGELKNALAVGQAVLELSEERKENAVLRAQLSEAQARLAEIERQEPVEYAVYEHGRLIAHVPRSDGQWFNTDLKYEPRYAAPVSPAAQATDARMAAVEQAAALAEKVSGPGTARTIRHNGVVMRGDCECPTCKRY